MTQRFNQRRREMIALADEQRAALAQQIQDFERPLEFASHAWAVVQYLKSHPLLVALPVGLFAMRRSRMLLRWISRGWLAREVIRKYFIR